jgi:hypothetical protein
MNIIQLKKELKGKFFSATFVKKNGEVRTIHGRLGVIKALKGGALRYNAEQVGNLVVFDLKKKEYRTIPLDRIVTLRYNKKEVTGQYALRMALT